MSIPEKKEGWVSLINAKAEHYVVDGISLCKRWGYFGTLFRERNRWTACAACTRKLAERERQALAALFNFYSQEVQP